MYVWWMLCSCLYRLLSEYVVEMWSNQNSKFKQFNSYIMWRWYESIWHAKSYICLLEESGWLTCVATWDYITEYWLVCIASCHLTLKSFCGRTKWTCFQHEWISHNTYSSNIPSLFIQYSWTKKAYLHEIHLKYAKHTTFFLYNIINWQTMM